MKLPLRYALVLALGCLPLAAIHADEDSGNAPTVALGMTREQFAHAVELGGRDVISEVGTVVALTGRDSGIEFERYQFTLPAGVQPARLWQITVVYHAPSTRATFDRLEAELTDRWGRPTQTTSRAGGSEGPAYERRVWESDAQVVTLVGCPDGVTADEASRMQVTMTDRTLQRIGLVQRKPKPHSH